MNHLSQEQRYTIAYMRHNGMSQQLIADAIGKNKSTVSRELSRNRDKRSGKYSAELAQRKAIDRKESKSRRVTFNCLLKAKVTALLEKRYSPEQIAGTFKKEEGSNVISHESIYKFVWKNKKQGGDLHKYLRNKGKKYRKRGSDKDSRGLLPGRVNISQRPAEIEKRDRLGDWEIDTIIGKDHKGAIVTINDRATGLLRMRKLKGKDSKELCTAVIEMLSNPRYCNKSITSDNGKEFAQFAEIAQGLKIDFYFANP